MKRKPNKPSPNELRAFRRHQIEMLKRCRILKAGDEVRFIKMPHGSEIPWVCFHADTRRLYKKLIARKRPTKVTYLDDDGLPWIEYRCRGKDGRMEYHSLLIIDDSWVRVNKRPPKSP